MARGGGGTKKDRRKREYTHTTHIYTVVPHRSFSFFFARSVLFGNTDTHNGMSGWTHSRQKIMPKTFLFFKIRLRSPIKSDRKKKSTFGTENGTENGLKMDRWDKWDMSY